MTEVADFQQHLDEDGLIDEVNSKDVAFAIFLTAIIESASENYRLPLVMASADCLEIRNDELCLGEIEVWIYAENDYIGWECTECAADGAISNWQGSRWDMRDTTTH